MGILTEGEANDLTRQQELRSRAVRLTAQWSEKEQVLAVWLSGSVARGPVNHASDLDLHIVTQPSLGDDVPPWHFGPDGVIENVHLVPCQEIEEGSRRRRDTAALAQWLQATALGDELQGGECLYCRPGWGWIADRVRDLLEWRLDASVIEALSRRHAMVAQDWVNRAIANLNDGAVLDGHQKLRYAAQSLLVAALIRCGWTIRGSKKRPEIARAYIASQAVSKVLALVEEIVGLAGLTEPEAGATCMARMALRHLLLDELRSLLQEGHVNDSGIRNRVVQEIAFQERHNASAVDYYRPLLHAGFLQGPVNHVRALSGFARIPLRLASCLHSDCASPIAWWIDGAGFCMRLLGAWLSVAQLNPSSSVVREWARTLSAEAVLMCAGPCETL